MRNSARCHEKGGQFCMGVQEGGCFALPSQRLSKTGLLRSLADHHKNDRHCPRRRLRFFIRIRASELAYRHFYEKPGLLRSLADHEKRWSAPRRRRFFIRIRASELADEHSRKAGCCAAWQTTKNDGLPAPRAAVFHSYPCQRAGISTLIEKTGLRTGQRGDLGGRNAERGVRPTAGRFFIPIYVRDVSHTAAARNINTLEKPGDTFASQPGQTTEDDGLPHGRGSG